MMSLRISLPAEVADAKPDAGVDVREAKALDVPAEAVRETIEETAPRASAQ